MKKGICVHYNSVLHEKTCIKNINYKELSGGTLIIFNLPCVKSGEGKSGITCDEYLEPTQEQLDQYRKDTDEFFDKAIRNLHLTGVMKKELPNGGTGEMECPECKGVLHYAVNSGNQHTSARCETENCLGWIE